MSKLWDLPIVDRYWEENGYYRNRVAFFDSEETLIEALQANYSSVFKYGYPVKRPPDSDLLKGHCQEYDFLQAIFRDGRAWYLGIWLKEA